MPEYVIARSPQFVALPTLPDGCTYVLPFSNGIDVTRITIRCGRYVLSMLYDIKCAVGCERDKVTNEPLPYVELFDKDNRMLLFDGVRRFLIPEEVIELHETILNWCACAKN